MDINKDTLHKIAHLARLEVDPAREQQLTEKLQSILGWMEQLNEVDTDGVEPLTYMGPESNVWRQDEVVELLSHEEGLANAPKRDSDYFRVPKVIE